MELTIMNKGQMVSPLSEKQGVGSSILPLPTNMNNYFFFLDFKTNKTDTKTEKN